MAVRPLARHALDAALGLLVTALSVLLAEAALWGLGVTPAPPLELSRGFDATEAYVAPDPERAGSWRTHIDTPAIDSRPIPPRGALRRVLLFGGSNTRSFREPYLLERLNADPEAAYEVFNLGRPGYGTGRVAILFEQAVEALEPDFVVVYAGHNEFVERSMRVQVEGTWGEPWQRAMADLAQRTRVVRVLRDVAQGRRPPRHARRDQWHQEYARFEGLPYAETRREFARYADNLRRMVRFAAERDVRVVLSTVVYNRFSAPWVSTLPADLEPASRARLEQHRRAAAAASPAWLAPLLPDSPLQRVRMAQWGRSRGVTTADLPGLRPFQGRLAGREPLFPKGAWSPQVFELYEALARLHAGASSEERPGLERAATELDAALALAPEHPGASFERAIVAWALGERGPSVQRWFEDAARFDCAPRKANGLVNDHVRAVAAELPQVLLVDADEHARAAFADGVVGWELMTDHCHVSQVGAELVLDLVAEAILESVEGD